MKLLLVRTALYLNCNNGVTRYGASQIQHFRSSKEKQGFCIAFKHNFILTEFFL